MSATFNVDYQRAMNMVKHFKPDGLTLIISWYGAVLFTLSFALLLLIHISTPQVVSTAIGPHYQMYKALPSAVEGTGGQSIEITKSDGRTTIIASFFKSRKSPLAEMADKFVETADQNNLDYRLLPAIAMQESNGGKIMPKNSFNPFGYGIYGGNVLRFASFEEAIEKVAQGLQKNYISQGLNTPDKIMAKYTPPSLQKGGAWAIGVSAFMNQLD